MPDDWECMAHVMFKMLGSRPQSVSHLPSLLAFYVDHILSQYCFPKEAIPFSPGFLVLCICQ